MTARAEWLTAGGPAAPWVELGLVLHEGVVPLFGTGIRLLDD